MEKLAKPICKGGIWMGRKLWKLLFGRPERPERELSKLYRCLLEIRYMIYLFVLTFFIIQPFVIAGYETPTGSMEPTIMANTRYLALPSIYGGFLRFSAIKLPAYRKIRRGDIIIFKAPATEGENYVKRVIALPGEWVEVKDKTVWINGKVLDEPYAYFEPGCRTRTGFGPEKVPQNQLFVMGDNRDNSFDSRYWGFLPVEKVFGTPLITFWSYDSAKHRIRFKEIFKLLK
jgi:signal peptidase I